MRNGEWGMNGRGGERFPIPSQGRHSWRPFRVLIHKTMVFRRGADAAPVWERSATSCPAGGASPPLRGDTAFADANYGVPAGNAVFRGRHEWRPYGEYGIRGRQLWRPCGEMSEHIRCSAAATVHSPFPIPHSSLSRSYSCSLFPVACSLLPVPYCLLPIAYCLLLFLFPCSSQQILHHLSPAVNRRGVLSPCFVHHSFTNLSVDGNWYTVL